MPTLEEPSVLLRGRYRLFPHRENQNEKARRVFRVTPRIVLSLGDAEASVQRHVARLVLDVLEKRRRQGAMRAIEEIDTARLAGNTASRSVAESWDR